MALLDDDTTQQPNPLLGALAPPQGNALGDLYRRLFGPSDSISPIWPTSNPTGTERLVDYRGWDTATPQAPADISQTHAALAQDPNVGNILPIRYNDQGVTGLAVPNMLRGAAQGAYDLSQGPRLGGMTPEATMALASTVDPLARYDPDTLAALRVATRAGNIARVEARGAGNVTSDVSPALGRAIGGLLDEHLAQGGIPLYGGRGTEGTDIVVTLPPGVSSAAELQRRQQAMVDRATAMTQNVAPGTTPPRYWYQEGAGAIHAATGQDPEASQRLASSLAITSPQTDVAGNANAAVNAWNQSLLGQDIAVKMAPQNRALEETLYGSFVPESRKTGPFAENHMRYIQPEVGNNLTNDIWQMRDAGYTSFNRAGDPVPYSGTPTVGEDNYVRMMVDRATRQLNATGVDGGGWTPDQVQAALWVHAKTTQETGAAFPANFNFKNALERLQAGQTNAHFGGPTLVPGDAASQAQFHQAIQPIMSDENGRDIINAGLGMLTPPNVPGGAMVSMTADGIKDSSRALMDASTLTRAMLLRQPDALWTSHPDVAGLPSIANANVVLSHSSDPAEHALQLRMALDHAGGGLENSVLQQAPGGVRILNVNERTGLDNRTFQSGVRDAISGAGIPADLRRARADYGYFTHDWTSDPTGSSYVRAIGQLPANLQRASDQLVANLGSRIDAAASQVSGRPSTPGPWGQAGFGQAVTPAQLPLRPWQQRPSPGGPGSVLPGLLGIGQ
jgi:hypothetical protein